MQIAKNSHVGIYDGRIGVIPVIESHQNGLIRFVIAALVSSATII
jgi:hypothetical protein